MTRILEKALLFTTVRLGDILIFGTTENQHRQHLDQVLNIHRFPTQVKFACVLF